VASDRECYSQRVSRYERSALRSRYATHFPRACLGSHEIVRSQWSFNGQRMLRHVGCQTNLPKELILSNYFKVRNGKIVSLVIILNQPGILAPRSHRGGHARLSFGSGREKDCYSALLCSSDDAEVSGTGRDG